MVAGSPENISPRPGLAGAEGVSEARKSCELGRVTGTGAQKTRLEDLELIFGAGEL